MRVWPFLLVLMAGGPALAQPPPPPADVSQVPVDKGPDTPAANGAYQGGGLVLQGQPGAPAPQPQPTPPGQTPANTAPAPSP